MTLESQKPQEPQNFRSDKPLYRKEPEKIKINKCQKKFIEKVKINKLN